MIYFSVIALIVAFLLMAFAFIETVLGMGPWSRAATSDDTISLLGKASAVLFVLGVLSFVWHLIGG
jgi:hypothetical protein